MPRPGSVGNRILIATEELMLFALCQTSGDTARGTDPTLCRFQIGDTAQRGEAATKRSAPVLGRSSLGRSTRFETIPGATAGRSCCGRDVRTPENSHGWRRFREILVERGEAASKGARGCDVCDPQELCGPPSVLTNPAPRSLPTCCGSQSRAPKNLCELRRFWEILIDCKSAL